MKDNFTSKEFILELIYSIIDDHNNLNPDDLKIEKSLDTILLGSGGKLDSLGLVNLLVGIENIIQKNIDQNIFIIEEILFLDENGPYHNINNLLDYIFKKMQ